MADVAPAAVARQLLMGFRGTDLLYVMAELEIADQLANGPLDSAELAARLDAHPDALHRVLRALAQLGVLDHQPDGRFALTPVGDCLRSDRADSLRPMARFWGHETIQRPWGNLLHSVRTGESAFLHIFGVPVFDYLETDPDLAAIYHDGMARMRAAATAAIPAAYDFAPFGTIVDVGGGNGSLLVEILHAFPQPRGIVFDLPHAREEAQAALQDAGLAERVRFDAGDFFAAVTTGGDCYLLRQVIHDWDDARADAILRTCRRAISPSGRLLLIELLLPDQGDPGLDAVMADVTMLVRVGGRERTAAEFGALLDGAGFRLDRVIRTSGPHTILECFPM